MSDVTVVGLGLMGSAIGRALVRGGHRVTVWNRTSSKAEPLVEAGATLAPDVAAAVRSSPTVVVCVSSYEVAHSLLSAPEVEQHLRDRIVIQLGGGTPQEAQAGERWAQALGAAYLDGEIMVYPEEVGTPAGAILLAGDATVYQRCEPLLRSVAGNLIYVGEEVGAANAYGMAMGAVLFGALLGALHGAQICQVEGLGVDTFAARLAAADMRTIAAAVQDMLDRVHARRYGDTQGSLQTGAESATQLLEHARATGIDTAFPAYAEAALGRAVEAGLGDQDVAALIQVLRGGR
jgi:3-hydroxyisobutyrate dehydrogenase-like beta-hydroxyacid dehydrogenase